MNILITGIHGFIGTNLVAAIKLEHSIYGLDITAPTKEGVIKTFAWDDLEQVPLVDCIIHLAGKAHDTKNEKVAQSYFDVNLGLTQTIYSWFLKSEAKKFIFFSSVKAAADGVENKILTEDVIPSPKGPYGESKIAAENYILSNSPQNKQVFILRPSMTHGPGNKGNLNLLYKIVKKGIPWPLGAFENERSFVSIDNLSYVINQLIMQDIETGIYNLADDQTLSTNKLVELIAHTLGKKAQIWKFPKGLLKQMAKVGDILHLPLNSERLRKLTESYVVSNEKIKKAIGIQKLPITAEQGMLKTLESFRSNSLK